MNNNEILEMNKKEKELDEKLKYVNETMEQYKNQLREYKESHPEEFNNKDTEITDINAIGSIKALRIEKEKRDKLQEEKDTLTKIREEEKKQVQAKLEYVQGTIEQYKNQLIEYKESHLEEFNNKDTQITDIHAIGSLNALKIEIEKEKQLQEKMKILNFDEEINLINEEEQQPSQPIKLNEEKEDNYIVEDIEKLLNDDVTITNDVTNKNSEVKPILSMRDENEPKKVNNPIILKTPNLENKKDETIENDLEMLDDDLEMSDDDLEMIDEDLEIPEDDIEMLEFDEETEISDNNEAIRIAYYAKTDKYIVKNVNTKQIKIVNRKDLDKLDKNILSKKLGKDLTNIDTNILQLLLSYDKLYKTYKAQEYLEMISEQGKNKEQRQEEMAEHQIEIEYNLKGLYNKHDEGLYEPIYNFSREEREEILNIANIAKNKGIAKVKKGIKVTVMEMIDRMIAKFSLKKLLEGSDVEVEEIPENKEQEELEKQYKKALRRTKQNKKAMKNIENIARSQRRTSENSKNGYVWENGNIVPKVNVDHELALNNIQNNENTNEINIEEEK